MMHIAQQLHDGVAQDLWFANLQVRLLRDALAVGASDEAAEIVDVLQSALERGYREVRDLLSHSDRSDSVSELADLREFCADLSRSGALSISFDDTVDVTEISSPIVRQLQRIAREAVMNAYKHGGARNVRVSLRVTSEEAHLMVADDGCGFDPRRTISGKQFGIQSMTDRAEAIGGVFNLMASPGRGTVVEISVPDRCCGTQLIDRVAS